MEWGLGPIARPQQSEQTNLMKKERHPARCWDYAESTWNGTLFGIAAAALHQFHHAITDQIPDNIPVHVLGECAAFALGGAVLFAAASAICNFLTRAKQFR